MDSAAIPSIAEGQFLVRNLYLSVDPAQRGWAADGTNYAAPVQLGSVMRALAVGVIEESRSDAFPADSYVYGWFGWQEYAVAVPADVLTQWSEPRLRLSAYAGILGINGLTAYLAFHDLGRPREGNVALVSTAAGSVGSVVGQLAKAAGCMTVGLTGSDDKVELCRTRFGYDVAINYRTDDLATALTYAAPDGFDILFDSAGGANLDTALRQMRVGARVVQCGTASIASWSPTPTGPRNEREVLTRRLSWSGFVIFDHAHRFPEAMERLATLIEKGELVFDEDIRRGLEAAPHALTDLYSGENRGKTLIDLTAEA